ncbi:hypothetical protein A1O3_00014 [Capronia epimyces CBS 606.96]|uniref:Uncharacterized protein n=1 Tax=Capronia epimyces CBS 606.96 TaxID=1182542 RepID=W9YQE2_9EURO|nr:uncharacterized protein A1O3_00014 [Capronia epimyces CBS 606.96]EXJ91466.1 hypothetical protein A1O3_00014 [Capronia epimyces CBS 606.96]
MSRDPRIRARTASHNVSDPSPAPSHGEQERRDYFTKRDCSASEVNTPQSPRSNGQNPRLARSEASELQKALLAFVSNAVDSSLARRKRDFMQAKAQSARTKYERYQRCFAQFPVVVEQALEEQKEIDSDFEYTQHEMRRCSEAENGATSDLARRLFDIVAKDNQESRSHAAQLHDLRRDMEELRSQATTNKEAQEAAAKLVDLAAENEALWKRVNSLQDRLPAIRQENEAVQKSVYSLQDRVKTMEQDLRDSRQRESEYSAKMDVSLRKEIVEVREQTQKLSADVKLLEEGSNGLESMKKSTNLELTQIQTRLGDAEDKMGLLQKDVAGDMRETETLYSQLADIKGKFETLENSIRSVESESHAMKDRFSTLQQTGTGFTDRIKLLQESLDGQIRNWNSLRTDVSALKSELATSLAQSSNEDLRAQLQELHDRVEKFTSETARENKARDGLLAEEIERINQDLSDRIDEIQHELMEVEKASKAQLSAPSLSTEHLQKLEILAGLQPRLRELEAGVGRLQKGLEKNIHMIQWQTHRFDNLTSETLVRQMIGVLSPILPKFEQGLVKVEAEIMQIQRKLAEPMAKVDAPPPENEQSIKAFEEGLALARTEAKLEYESLACEFRTTCDEVMVNFRRLEDLQNQSESQLATYRSTTEKKISDIEGQLDSLRMMLSRKDSSPTSSPSIRRAHSTLCLNNKGNATPSRQKSSVIERSNQDTIVCLQEPDGGGKVTVEPEELDADEIGKEASILLESFQKQPGRTLGRMKSTKSAKIGARTQPPTKRKRNDSDELDDASGSGSPTPEDTVLVQPHLQPRAAKRKNKPNDN